MPHPPRWAWQCLACACLGALLGVLGATALHGQSGAPPQAVTAESASTALREENARLRQLQAIDREAQATLRERIAGLVAQNGELTRRLALLRGVLVPDGQTPELGIAELLLSPQAVGGQFGYRLLLVRVPPPASGGTLNGRVEVRSLGQMDGQPQELRLAQLRLALPRLQTLAGTLALPAGFQPQRLRVVLQPRGQAEQVFDFAWQDLVAAGPPMTAATPLP